MSIDGREPAVLPRWVGRLAAVLLGTTLALAIAVGVLLARRPPERNPALELQQAMNDPAVRERVIASLVARNPGIWDSHNDATVGRVLQNGLRGRPALGSTVVSNDWGLRERPIVAPKPAGLTRVVLLGDSLVFGEGIAAEDRMGAFLERFLSERAASAGTGIEVLHVGIGSWNVLAECAFVRRNLSLLEPDLVIHLTTSNDLDDTDGVRGFGSKAAFSPQRRSMADSRVVMNYPGFVLGLGEANNLVLGVDYEGRSRFEQASRAMLELKQALERRGARYLAWFHWGGLHDFTRLYLTRGLDEREVLYNSRGFAGDRSTWVSESDSHWNRTGMEHVAKLLYGAIEQRDLLPALGLAEWDEAVQVLRAEHESELEFLEAPPRYSAWPQYRQVGRDFSVAELSESNAAHVNGGLDRRGRVSPYASFTMLIDRDGELAPGTRIGIQGRGLGRTELAGVHVAVWADEILLDTLEIPVEGAFERDWPLPAELDGRPFVSLRLIADDYVYDEENRQHCVVFELERITVF